MAPAASMSLFAKKIDPAANKANQNVFTIHQAIQANFTKHTPLKLIR